MAQSKTHSALEAFANVVVGYLIMVAAQAIIFPFHGIYVDWSSNLEIGLNFMLVSLARSYALRRIFNRL